MSLADEFEAGIPTEQTLPAVTVTAKRLPKSLADEFEQIDPSKVIAQPEEKPEEGFLDFTARNLENLYQKTKEGAGNAIYGAVKGLADPIYGLSQLAMHGLKATGNKYLGEKSDQLDATIGNVEKQYQADTPGSFAAGLGRVTGSVAPFLMSGGASAPASLPTLIGRGAATGAALGTTQPVNEGGDYWKEKATQAAIGGVTGGVIPAAGGLYNKASGVVADLTKPFTEQGRTEKLAEFLQKNVSNPYLASKDLNNIPQYVPGSSPTTAQALGDSRLLSVERAAKLQQPYGTLFDDLSRRNNEARVNILQDMAGDGGKYDFFKTDRDTVAKQLYADAKAAYDGDNMTPYLKGQVTQLLKRPSINEASKQAQMMAIERGEKPSPMGSFTALQDVKTALDDKIEEAVRAGKGGYASALGATKNKLVNVMEKLSPDYEAARKTYAQMSAPLNQMDEVRKISSRLQTAAQDPSGVPILTRAQMAQGFKTVDQSKLQPEQISALENILKDLHRADQTNLAQRAQGSNTPQDLSNMEIINGMLGKSKLLNSVPFIGNAAKSFSENAANDLQKKLAQALINPKFAQPLFAMELGAPKTALPQNVIQKLMYAAPRLVAPSN